MKIPKGSVYKLAPFGTLVAVKIFLFRGRLIDSSTLSISRFESFELKRSKIQTSFVFICRLDKLNFAKHCYQSG